MAYDTPTNAFSQKFIDNYHDHAQVTEPGSYTDLRCGDHQRKSPRGKVKIPFTTKLHILLSEVEERGLRHIVSWWGSSLHYFVRRFRCSDMPTQKLNNSFITFVPGNRTEDALWCTSRENSWRKSCQLVSASRSSHHSSVSWICTVSSAYLKVLTAAGTTTSYSWGISCSCAEQWWDIIAFSNK